MKENKLLNALPVDVKNDVLETLKVYDGCYVLQNENTKSYRVDVGIGISSSYNPYKCIASFNNSDVYTDDEIKENNKRLSLFL